MGDTQSAFFRMVPHIVDVDPDETGVISYADRRFVFFHTPMFAELFKNMESVTGPVIDRQIQAFGEQAGRTIAEKMDQKFKHTSIREAVSLLWQSGGDVTGLRDIAPTDDVAMMQKIFGYGRYVGWVGEITLEAYDKGNTAVFRAHNTFEPSSYGTTGQKECRFIPGVLKGIIDHYWDTSVTVTEQECACEGQDYCTIEVKHDD